MSDLIIFLNEASEMKVNTMIEKLKSCFSEEKYRMQTIILDRIIQTNVILDEKAETFWQYVLNDSDNWRFHHSTVLNFVAIYFVISEIVNAIKKERSVYQKTIHIIERLWEKKKYEYAVNQSIEMLRNMRKVVIKDWFIHDVMKTMIKVIDYRLKNSEREVRKKATSTNDDWAKIAEEVFMSSRLLIETRIVVIMSSSFAVRLEKKKNRKITFVVLFFSMMLSSIEKKKNQRAIFVDLSFDQASSSSSLTSSFVESSSANSSFSSSLFSITLKKLAIMSKALLNDISNSIETRCDENFLNRFQDFVFSFVLSSRLIFFASFSLTLSILSSSLSLSRSQKRVRSASSTSLKKRIKSANHCECILSIKWLDDFKNARCFISLKSVEHLLERLYYLDRQICLRHINQLRQLFELLSIDDLIEMKNVLWELLKFEEEVKIFKIDRSNLFEVSKVDD